MKRVLLLGVLLLFLTSCHLNTNKSSESSSSEDDYDYGTYNDSSYDNQENDSTEESTEVSSYEHTSSNATTEQEQTLIAFTQLDCEDRGYKISYGGNDKWNVAKQGNRWIVTKEDSQYKRIKSIYEWDGEENSGATLIYLLINGEELVNNL